MSDNLITDQWAAGAGIYGKFICALACQITRKSWSDSTQLILFSYHDTH